MSVLIQDVKKEKTPLFLWDSRTYIIVLGFDQPDSARTLIENKTNCYVLQRRVLFQQTFVAFFSN